MHEMLSIGKKDKTLTGLNISQYQHDFDMNKSILLVFLATDLF